MIRVEHVKKRKKQGRIAAFINHPVTDGVVMVLIMVSVVLLVLEETMDAGPGSPLALASDLVTGVFAVELLLRFIAAKKKGRFFRRYWPDLLALLPLLRPLRFFRFFRLFRLFRLFQLGQLLDRRFSVLRGIFRVNFSFLWALMVITVIFVLGSAVMGFLFEHGRGESFGSLPDAFWWALYSIIAGEPIGDMPQSQTGRVLLATMMLGGMTLFAVFTGMVSATMISRLQEQGRLGELDIDELEEHLVICGWNDGVPPLLSELAVDEELRGTPMVLVNTLERLPELEATGVRKELLYHVQGDYTQLAVLERAGVARATRAVVMADHTRSHSQEDRDARSVLAALTIERMQPEIFCVVELMNASNQAHLKMGRVEAVVLRADLSGRALASACRHPNLMEAMMELLTLRRGATMHRVPGPKAPVLFSELVNRLKAEEDLLVIGVERAPERGGETVLNPPRGAVVNPGDFLLVIGGTEEP